MEDKKYALKIYPKAQSDLETLFRYISKELSNPYAASSIIDEIESSLELVCLNPKMCPTVRSNLIKDKNLRKLIVKSYIVFYRPDEQKEEIQVVRVLYGMTNYEKLL